MRICAILLIAACSNAPAPPPASAKATEVMASVSMLDPSVDPWANTRADPYAVVPVTPNPPRFAAPTIAGPIRTELAVDRTPAMRVASMSGTIELLAVTDDGLAAITADVSRSVRLWPTLDGKREPLVLTLPAPSMLAIARHDNAFAIASVDAIGQLQLVRATTTAEVTRRLDVGLARPVVALHATSTGFITLRDDRVVTLLDLDGTIRAELAAEPGDYVASVAVREGAALALIENEESVHGRWIDLATARWGARTKNLPFRDGENVALSSDHERVAGRRRRGDAIAIVALATGKIIDTLEDAEANVHVLGFLTDRQLVLRADDRGWFFEDEGEGFSVRAFAFAKGHLFSDNDTAIAIRSKTDPVSYLGYQLSNITQMRPTKKGFLATDMRSMVELDTSFKTRTGFSVAEGVHGLGTLTLAHDERALGFSGIENRSLYLLSTNGQTSTLVADSVDTFVYEPKTRLLHYLQRGRHHIARFDTTAKVFGPAVAVSESSTIVLLDPLESNGDEIAEITTKSDKYLVKTGRFDASGFTATREREAMPSEEWWNENGDLSMLVRSNRRRARSPDGTMTAEIIDRRRLELREGTTVRWSIPSAGMIDLLWTRQGDLVVFGAGMAKIDLATGALRDRQCGAWFGRWQYEPGSFGTPSLCEVP